MVDTVLSEVAAAYQWPADFVSEYLHCGLAILGRTIRFLLAWAMARDCWADQRVAAAAAAAAAANTLLYRPSGRQVNMRYQVNLVTDPQCLEQGKGQSFVDGKEDAEIIPGRVEGHWACHQPTRLE